MTDLTIFTSIPQNEPLYAFVDGKFVPVAAGEGGKYQVSWFVDNDEASSGTVTVPIFDGAAYTAATAVRCFWPAGSILVPHPDPSYPRLLLPPHKGPACRRQRGSVQVVHGQRVVRGALQPVAAGADRSRGHPRPRRRPLQGR